MTFIVCRIRLNCTMSVIIVCLCIRKRGEKTLGNLVSKRGRNIREQKLRDTLYRNIMANSEGIRMSRARLSRYVVRMGVNRMTTGRTGTN